MESCEYNAMSKMWKNVQTSIVTNMLNIWLTSEKDVQGVHCRDSKSVDRHSWKKFNGGNKYVL